MTSGKPRLTADAAQEMIARAGAAPAVGGRAPIAMSHRLFALTLVLAALPGEPALAQAAPRYAVEIETGPVWQSRNDVRIPNDASATRYSLVDLLGNGPWTAARVSLTRTGHNGRELRLLAAPLSVTETGTPATSIRFAGAGFAALTPTAATYQFNSYRATYRWRMHHGDRWTWWVGGTAKVRDARIELRQGATSARKTDLGFVPLLHVGGEARFDESWRLTFDADALAGGPGRAEDAAVKVARNFGDGWRVSAGYRTVEGGAGVDAVYTFAWLHYAVLSVRKAF